MAAKLPLTDFRISVGWQGWRAIHHIILHPHNLRPKVYSKRPKSISTGLAEDQAAFHRPLAASTLLAGGRINTLSALQRGEELAIYQAGPPSSA